MKLHFSQAWNNIKNFSCGYVGILKLLQSFYVNMRVADL